MGLLKLGSIAKKRRDKQPAVPASFITPTKLEPLTLSLDLDIPRAQPIQPSASVSTPAALTKPLPDVEPVTTSAGTGDFFDDIFSRLDAVGKPQDDLQTDLSLAFALSMKLENEPEKATSSETTSTSPTTSAAKTSNLFGSDSIYYRNTSMFANLMSSPNPTTTISTSTAAKPSTALGNPPRSPPPSGATLPGTTQVVLDSDISDSEDDQQTDSSQDDDEVLAGQRMTKGMKPILERRAHDHRRPNHRDRRIDPEAKLAEQNENMIARMKDRHRQQYKVVAMRQQQQYQQQQQFAIPPGMMPPYPVMAMDHGPVDHMVPVIMDHGVPNMVDPNLQYAHPVVDPGMSGPMTGPSQYPPNMSYSGHVVGGTTHAAYGVPAGPNQSDFLEPHDYPGTHRREKNTSVRRDHVVSSIHEANSPHDNAGTSPVDLSSGSQRSSPAASVGNSPLPTIRETSPTLSKSHTTQASRPSVRSPPQAPQDNSSVSVHSASSHSVASLPVSHGKPSPKPSPQSSKSMSPQREGDDADDENDSDGSIIVQPVSNSSSKKKQLRYSRSVPNLKKKKKAAASSQDGRSHTRRGSQDDTISTTISATTAPQPSNRQRLKHAQSEPDIPQQMHPHLMQQQYPWQQHPQQYNGMPIAQHGQRHYQELQQEWERMQAYQREQQLKQQYTQQFYASRQPQQPAFVPVVYNGMDVPMVGTSHSQRHHYPVQVPHMSSYYQQQQLQPYYSMR